MANSKPGLGSRIAPPRFIAFMVILVIAIGIAIPTLGWKHGVMTGFDVAAVFFLIAVTPLLGAHSPTDMRKHAAENDANRAGLLAISTIVSLTILTTVFAEMRDKETANAPLIVGTLVAAWLFANTVYALHYAHLYYLKGSKGGLGFSGTQEPDYSDFVYFGFTLGMTFQTSDTAIETRQFRRIVTMQSLAAFIFNIGVLAFTINTLGR